MPMIPAPDQPFPPQVRTPTPIDTTVPTGPPPPPPDLILPECSSCPALCCRSLNIQLSLACEHDRSLVKSLPDSCRLVGTRLLLRRRDDGSCILLHNHRCTVWNHRPLACRVYSCLSRPEADLLCFDALRHGINPKDTPPFFGALRLPQPPPNPELPAKPA